jgi:hypothetical protein
MHFSRTRMTDTRAPQTIPALIAGIAAFLLAFVLGPLIVVLVGVAAIIMAGMAYADARSHGYSGDGLAIAGGLLGVMAIAISVLGVALGYGYDAAEETPSTSIAFSRRPRSSIRCRSSALTASSIRSPA